LIGHRGHLAAGVGAVLAAALLGGCNGQNEKQKLLAGAPGDLNMSEAISAPDLAGRLGMKVQSTGAYSVTLRSRGNVVVLYADPGGQVYVNGSVVQQGGVLAVGKTLYVHRSVVGRIQRRLRGRGPAKPRPPKVEVPRPPKRPGRLGKVVVDAGHGGKDKGAIVFYRVGRRRVQVYEKDIVLDVARRVASRLGSAGATVKMTRTGDTFVELEERAAIANRFAADLFVSIHADSAKRRSAEGYGTYLSPSASSGSVEAAGAVARSMSGASIARHGTFRRRFKVLVLTRCPAVLVEIGFLTNPTELARLNDPAYRRRLADAVADGLIEYMRRNRK